MINILLCWGYILLILQDNFLGVDVPGMSGTTPYETEGITVKHTVDRKKAEPKGPQRFWPQRREVYQGPVLSGRNIGGCFKFEIDPKLNEEV